MDDGETVNPREAVGGLALLGAAMAALVGTFVYRTLMENPTRPRPAIEAPAIVNVEAPPSNLEPTAPEADAAAATPVQEPAPASAINAPDVSPPNSSTTDGNAASEAPPYQPEAAPRFVAPASHPN